jgi:hypothetical protein
MDTLYFEKQYGSLCGTHCLNNAMQGAWIDEVRMSEIARELDDVELEMLDPDGPEYQEMLAKRQSANYDDTGDFSVQVLQKALKDMFNVTMEPYKMHPGGLATNGEEKLFIVNVQNHWYCFRKFRRVWTELNSLNEGPQVVSEMYVFGIIHTLVTEGHSVFQVSGDLPMCNGDVWLEFDKPENFTHRKNFPPKGNTLVESQSQDFVRDGEEGLTKQEVVRRRRELMLKKIEADRAAKEKESKD